MRKTKLLEAEIELLAELGHAVFDIFEDKKVPDHLIVECLVRLMEATIVSVENREPEPEFRAYVIQRLTNLTDAEKEEEK